MLSKNLLKYVQSLQIKKYRQEHQAFLVEGAKSVCELAGADFDIEMLVSTEAFYKETISNWHKQPSRVEIATEDELTKAGTLQTNDSCLAVVRTKKNEFLCAGPNEYALVLDTIRDPGNLGTIVRIADWYGISKLICSETTTDFYNPKVIAASKGSFTRVRAFYTDLHQYFGKIYASSALPTPQPNVYGTFFDGQDVHHLPFATEGYIVLGNESNGITAEVEPFINRRVTIPRYGQAESLNVAIATAIVLDNLKKNARFV